MSGVVVGLAVWVGDGVVVGLAVWVGDGVVVEGTAGNTGIGLTLVGNARGYRTIIVMPDDQAPEKYELLRTYGADLRVVAAVPFTNDENYYHAARRIADQAGDAGNVRPGFHCLMLTKLSLLVDLTHAGRAQPVPDLSARPGWPRRARG